MLHLAMVLFLASPPPASEPTYVRLDLAPSGSQVSVGEPVVKGGMLVFHAYPDGKLMSLRKSDVKSSTKITAKEAAAPAATNPKPIANLAMQGGTATVVGAPGQPAGSSGQPAPAAAPAPRSVAPASSAATGTNAVLPPN